MPVIKLNAPDLKDQHPKAAALRNQAIDLKCQAEDAYMEAYLLDPEAEGYIEIPGLRADIISKMKRAYRWMQHSLDLDNLEIEYNHIEVEDRWFDISVKYQLKADDEIGLPQTNLWASMRVSLSYDGEANVIDWEVQLLGGEDGDYEMDVSELPIQLLATLISEGALSPDLTAKAAAVPSSEQPTEES